MTLPRPRLDRMTENGSETRFTLTGIHTSLANSLRRAILTNLPVLVVRTETHAISQLTVIANTSRMHNEMFGQRVSCVPIHSSEPDFGDRYQLELDVSNSGTFAILVTTEHVRLRDLSSGDLVPEAQSRRVFPPDPFTGDYIHLLTLHPSVGNIPAERIACTARFSWASAADNGMFIAAIASYGNTQDTERSGAEWAIREAALRTQEQGANQDEVVDAAKRDFYALDAARFYIENSFDFMVQSVGVYKNLDCVKTACTFLVKKYQDIILAVESNVLPVFSSLETRTVGGYDSVLESSTANSYDIILEGMDETVGGPLAHAVSAVTTEDEVSYVMFRKMHPHDTFGLLRIVLYKGVDPSALSRVLQLACAELIRVFTEVSQLM